jgi:hypothetical protein
MPPRGENRGTTISSETAGPADAVAGAFVSRICYEHCSYPRHPCHGALLAFSCDNFVSS